MDCTLAFGCRTWCDWQMRALIPDVIEDLTDADLTHVYAWPEDRQTSWLRMNFASSIDGAVTDSDGLSAGVSSSDDKRVFALLRATCDAVLVGAGTARAEGYGPVTIRDSMQPLRRKLGLSSPPRLVIISNSAELDPDSAPFAEADPSARTIVVTSESADPERVAALRQVGEVVQTGDDNVNLADVRKLLGALGLFRLLCEGGPTLFGSMLTAGIVDDLCLTTSPLIAGQSAENRTTLTGHEALPATHDARLASLVQAQNSLLARWQISS